MAVKSKALISAEAQIENQKAALKALEDKVAQLCFALAAKAAPEPAAEQPAQGPAVHVDTWLPRLDVIEPQLKRPVLAVFDCRESAWEFRNAHAKSVQRPVAVGYKGGPVRSPAGPVWIVY